MIDNNDGLFISNRASVVMFRSIAAQNQSGNVVVLSLNPAHLTVSECLVQCINRNGQGIWAGNEADITVTRSTVADCQDGFLISGGNTLNWATTRSVTASSRRLVRSRHWLSINSDHLLDRPHREAFDESVEKCCAFRR